MNNEKWKYYIFVVFGVLTVIVMWTTVYINHQECERKNGSYMRTLWGTNTCYDKSSLRELK